MRRHGRLQPGRRRRPRAVELDGRRRSRLRRLGDGRRALRRLGDAWPTPTPRCARTIRGAFASAFRTRNLPAARPLRTTPVYDRLKARDAVFGDYCGLEHALWFAPTAPSRVEDVTFRRSNAHAHVGDECRAVRNGRRAARDLELRQVRGQRRRRRSVARPACWPTGCRAKGRIALSPMLNEHGKLIGDFTVATRRRGTLLHLRHLCRREVLSALVRAPSCRRRASRCARCATDYVGLSLAGPKSRELLQALVARRPVDARRFRSCPSGRMDVGMIPRDRRPHLLHRRSRLRDLGGTPDYQRALYDAAARGRAGSWPASFRGARAALAAARKELRHLGARIPADLRTPRSRARSLRRPREARLHRPRGGGGGTRQAAPPAGW